MARAKRARSRKSRTKALALQAGAEKNLWQVEYILYAEVVGQLKSQRRWQYKVKWFGFPDKDNTWESESSFKGDIVQAFWKDVELATTDELFVRDASEHCLGKRYSPSNNWITRTKAEAAQAAAAVGHAKGK